MAGGGGGAREAVVLYKSLHRKKRNIGFSLVKRLEGGGGRLKLWENCLKFLQ